MFLELLKNIKDNMALSCLLSASCLTTFIF